MTCNSANTRRRSVEILLERPRAKSAVNANADKKKARDPPTPGGGHLPLKRISAQHLEKINKPPTILKKELDRLKQAAIFVGTDDKIEAQLQHEKDVRDIEDEADRQKEKFKKIDEARFKAREDKDKSHIFHEDRVKVLEHSFIAKHEQEEEVKRVNQIMLNAKCHAIRDAQIQEKLELMRERKREEHRLEKIMIDRAKALLEAEDLQIKKDQEKKKKYAEEIKGQLLERENQRFIEAERIDEEAKMLHQANEALKREDERQVHIARERREQLRAELNRINEMSNLFKKMLFEQEREAERRILAYMKAKEKRERALEIEKNLSKQVFERKQQLLFDLQQKMLESKSQREEMALLREQENIEREYRHKEKQAALRKKALEKELHDSRERQLRDAKLREALQIARNESDFKKIVENLRREEAKQAKIQEERLKNRNRYRDDIIRQMNDKENERQRRHELDMADATDWLEREKQRQSNVKAVIQSKLATMREAHLPEKYIKDVEKQLSKISVSK